MFRRNLLIVFATMLPLVSQAVPFWGAQESLPPETAPIALGQGEFVWNPAAAPIGPIVVLVSLGEQRAYVYRNGVEIGVTTISSGKPGYGTPTGVFVILQKDKDHHSSKYNNAAMPYTQRLTWDGVALHAGGLPGYPSSHGCVHLPSKFAEELFAASPMGMTVVVVDEHSAPGEIAHPPAFSPVDATTGAPVSTERLVADQEFRIEPEKAPHGPVSILMSSPTSACWCCATASRSVARGSPCRIPPSRSGHIPSSCASSRAPLRRLGLPWRCRGTTTRTDAPFLTTRPRAYRCRPGLRRR